MTAYPQDVKSILLSMLTYDGIKQEISGRAKELGSLLLRRNPQRPAVFVGTATCGLGAGAGHTLAAVREFLKWHNVDAEVVETGCLGLCSAEPVVMVQLPRFARLVYSFVTKEKVEPLLSALLLEKRVPEEGLLGQIVLAGGNAKLPVFTRNGFQLEQCTKFMQSFLIWTA